MPILLLLPSPGRKIVQVKQVVKPIMITRILPLTLSVALFNNVPTAYTGAPNINEARIATNTAWLFNLSQYSESMVGIIVEARQVP